MYFSFCKTIPLFFFSCFTFIFFNLSAQPIPDSIPIGIINVKRPSIETQYRVQLNYIYPDSGRNHSKLVHITSQEILFQDSVFNPLAAQPLEAFESGTIRLADSAVANELVSQLPTRTFDWQKFLKHIDFSFNWTDTARSDSAQFEFSLDKNGRAKCKPLFWLIADSTCRTFERKSLYYMLRLWQWYPARIKKNVRKRKTKKIPCIIIVTVYAYDPNAGRLLPVESEIREK